jgi:hypothetical protein
MLYKLYYQQWQSKKRKWLSRRREYLQKEKRQVVESQESTKQFSVKKGKDNKRKRKLHLSEESLPTLKKTKLYKWQIRLNI